VSQQVEAQSAETGYRVAGGIMMIVSACLLIVVDLINMLTFPSFLFWREFPNWLIWIVFASLALVGGAFMFTRTHLLFSVFGGSLLIPSTASYALGVFETVLLGEYPAFSGIFVTYLILGPVAFVLSILSLVFLAKSKSEFR